MKVVAMCPSFVPSLAPTVLLSALRDAHADRPAAGAAIVEEQDPPTPARHVTGSRTRVTR